MTSLPKRQPGEGARKSSHGEEQGNVSSVPKPDPRIIRVQRTEKRG